jgi:hypothetical protein
MLKVKRYASRTTTKLSVGGMGRLHVSNSIVVTAADGRIVSITKNNLVKEDPKQLKAALDAKYKDGIATVLDTSIDKTVSSGEAVVAAFFEEIDLDAESEAMDEVVSSRFEVYSIITEYEFRQKELAGKLAVFEKLPSIIALSQKIDELHKELYVTQKLTFGKMPQIPPKGPTSKQYNAFKDRKKQALARFTEVEIKPLEIELANRKAEYLKAKAHDRDKQEVWKSGREQKSD